MRLNKLDHFVHDLYQDADVTDPEIIDVMEETRSHLEQSVRDLMIQGYSEEEATKLAMYRYGSKEHVDQLLTWVYRKERTFASWLLRIGISIAAATILCFIGTMIWSQHQSLTYADAFYSNESSIEAYERLLEDHLLLVSISGQDAASSRDFTIHKSIWLPELFISHGMYLIDEQHLTTTESFDVTKFGAVLALIGMTIYLVTSVIWSIIKLHHAGRLHLLSIVSVVFFNVLGYWFWALRK
ncbi:hypothetical protein ASF99_02005 [Exiguobacterium sp. Leaf187]|uniref:hypothetical protein n=1 Tax=Exiguobacterium sp. Leaf187 TaxID=1736294 RepID=UPI0006FCEC3C|nr:hypothetical protein [Exiguobacterium sp. Leaf187]KQS18684.1 hypothetical protein ASF99_02005 [Exiguobacterium sp. Leaf187]